MATISFIVFALIVLISSNEINPKTKVQIWNYSIFGPIFILLVVALIFGSSSWYALGAIISQCVISTLFSMGLMYYLLNKKFKLQSKELETPQEK